MEFFRYAVLLIILLSVLLGLLASLHQFFRRSGTLKANNSLAFLLLTFSLSVFNVLLLRTRFFGDYEHLYQMPLWFTLSFGPLFFYYTKYKLFPAYRFRGSDLKHLILPFLQVTLVFVISFQPIDNQILTWENFIRPYYGRIEYALFLTTSFLYALFSYRYVRYKLARLKKNGTSWEIDQATGLRHLVRQLVILAAIYTFFALTDFTAFHFFNRDLQEVNGYTHLGDLAMSAVLLWLVLTTYWKPLIYLKSRSQQNKKINISEIEDILTTEQRFRDAELTPLHLALQLRTSTRCIHQLIDHRNWREWLNDKRLIAVRATQQQHSTAIANLAEYFGFYSRHELMRKLQDRE